MAADRLKIPIARPHAKLAALSTRAKGVVVPLNRPILLIGSGSKVHLKLRGETIEEIHAAVLNVDGRISVFDLNTRSRLIVNDDQVTEADLRDGDTLLIGRIGFRCLDRRNARNDAGASDDADQPAPPFALRGETGEVRLNRRVMLIGKQAGCDVVLPGERPRDKHAILYSAAGNWIIRSLDPQHPVRVNGRRVLESDALAEGDVLKIGGVELRMERVEVADVTSSPARITEPVLEPPPPPELQTAPEPESAPAPEPESKREPEHEPSAAPASPEPKDLPQPAMAREPEVGTDVGTQTEPVPVDEPESAEPQLAPIPEPVFEPDPVFEPAPERELEPVAPAPSPTISADDRSSERGDERDDDDEAEIEMIDLEHVKTWGPLAFAVAMEQHPEALHRAASAEPSATEVSSGPSWLWVGLVAGAAAAALATVVVILIYW